MIHFTHYRSRIHHLLLPSLIIMLVLAGQPNVRADSTPVGFGACEVALAELAIDFQHNGPGTHQTTLPLPCSISLDGVTAVAFDAFFSEFSTSGAATALVTAELRAGGNVVASFAVLDLVQISAGTPRHIFRVGPVLNAPPGTTFDSIRFTSNLSAGANHLQLRGAYSGNRLRLVRAIGQFAPGGCHVLHSFASLDLPPTLTGTTSSAWFEQPINPPLDASLLRYVRHTGFGFSVNSNMISASVQSELKLDNDEYILLDNWQAPGATTAPSAGSSLFAPDSSLLVDYGTQQLLRDRRIVGWRHRFHKSGSGSLNVSMPAPIQMTFMFSDVLPLPGDANHDGSVNVDDLLAVILAWGSCTGCPCAPCQADVSPLPVGDCAVNVDDLLTVIVNWSGRP